MRGTRVKSIRRIAAAMSLTPGAYRLMKRNWIQRRRQNFRHAGSLLAAFSVRYLKTKLTGTRASLKRLRKGSQGGWMKV